MNKKLKQILSLLLAGSLLLSACGTEEGTVGSKKPDITDEGYIDTLTPKNDFYGYVNAHSLMEMDLDGKSARGTLYDLGDEVSEQSDVTAMHRQIKKYMQLSDNGRRIVDLTLDAVYAHEERRDSLPKCE